MHKNEKYRVFPYIYIIYLPITTRKKNVKQAVKSVAKHSKSNVINTGKEALRQEIARYQKGGGLINTKARQTGRLKTR